MKTITLKKAQSMAKKGELTLRQLRDVLPSTKGAKTPTRDWIRDHLDSDQVFFAKQYEGGNRLVVFMNGFYTYGDQNWTVLRVDGFSRILYETNEHGGYAAMSEEAYLDHCFVFAIGMNAMWQLKRNAGKRMSGMSESATDSEIMEGNADESTPDILEGIIEREEKAEEHERLRKAWLTLTEQQKAVIWQLSRP